MEERPRAATMMLCIAAHLAFVITTAMLPDERDDVAGAADFAARFESGGAHDNSVPLPVSFRLVQPSDTWGARCHC